MNENHSPAQRKQALSIKWRQYSGNTNGLRLAHWSTGFLCSVLSSSNVISWTKKNIMRFLVGGTPYTYMNAGKKSRMTSITRAEIYETTLTVNAIVINWALNVFSSLLLFYFSSDSDEVLRSNRDSFLQGKLLSC